LATGGTFHTVMYDSIITQNEQNYNNLATLLQIEGKGDLYELFEYGLPFPHEYKRYGNSYKIAWYVDGVFFTKKSTDYINDILARFILSFDNITYSTAHPIKQQDKQTLKLKLFKQLNSIKKNDFSAYHNKYEDNVFWSLKLFVEHYISKGGYCAYSILESYAFNHFIDHVKDRSTLKAKCRNIWNWYDAREWQTALTYEKKFTQKEYEMTRQENIDKVRTARAEATERKVIQAITGMFADDYKKKSGKWNISKIAKEIGVARDSVYKYIEKYEAEKKKSIT